jgi:DNA invertase Pin-like site-specific DNA recombinase/transposase
MSEFSKITERHRQRRAVVYVRQSTPGQVERNTESAARQYALAERAVELGWPTASVLVVDEDTGQSARWAHARIGFRELAAEVGLGHVGVILALEVSRLARSSADWHQLLDLCALTGTLIADADGIYSPGEFNDRLLLGLKGTMSEAELHLIRSRLRGGLENKAARGELRLPLPIGLERDEDGEIRLCVDEQVRGAIRRVFELWDRCGSGRQVVAELAAEGQRLPRRRITERRIRWEPPDYGAVHEILTNPNYAGAYAYGRHRTVKTVDADRGVKISQVKTPIAEWRVLITEHHPGYVSWEQYLETQRRLLANARPTGQGGGAAREGSALLQGLVRCAKCGRKMKVKYSGPSGRTHTYLCESTYQTQATSRVCQTIGGLRFDKTVVDAFLEAVTPAGVDATAAAVDQLEADHAERRHLQLLAVERVEYEAERRRRQFDACEPENRLVARSLERAYEEALADVERQRRALSELDRHRPAPLTERERRGLRRLAGELGRVWTAASTTDRDRKELLRALLDDVILDVDRARDTASVELIWQGGARTELPVRVKHSTVKRSGTRPELVDLVRRLAVHSSDREIAIVLSKHGWKSPTGLPFTQRRVRDLRERANIPPAPRTPPADAGVSIMQAARELRVSTMTIRRWLQEGLLPAEQTAEHAPWRIRLTDEVRRRFVPTVPDGYVKLDEAARRLGVARQTVLNQVRAGRRQAVMVVEGKRRGLRIEIHPDEQGLLEPAASRAG